MCQYQLHSGFSICIFRISDLHYTTLPILIYLYIVAVICGKTAVTWFAASTIQRRSAFSIPHFTFSIPHSAIPHFTHTRIYVSFNYNCIQFVLLLNIYQPIRCLHFPENHLIAKPSVYTSRSFVQLRCCTNAIPLNIRIS